MDGSLAPRVVVLISAKAEWQALVNQLHCEEPGCSPFGDYFLHDLPLTAGKESVRFFHGGWGKIAAAASAQYVIDRWTPALLVNLGTCGGFEGEIERGTVVLAHRTIVYDIIEMMGDCTESISHYTTDLDLSWLGGYSPPGVQATSLVSADRDLLMEEVPRLKERYGAVAGDWESGAIAWVAKQNGIRCLILRGVTDLVGVNGGEAYGNIELYQENTNRVMKRLVEELPAWISRLDEKN
jgi:adenosylhomocysteine nucleosidase